MSHNDQIKSITFVARPPCHLKNAADDSFLAAVAKTVSKRKAGNHAVIRVASVRDIDLELSAILTADHPGQLRVQLVGHGRSGALALGAHWIAERDVYAQAFKYPYYVLDTNPAALGLLSKHAGKLAKLTLVGCNIGAAASFGYAINGRTLTYTLTELLRCPVLGADDVVSANDFDARGWYAPRADRRSPSGWEWMPEGPPVWIEHAERRKKVA